MSCGMNVPNLKRIPSHSPSAGQAVAVAFVSGPRSVKERSCLCVASQPFQNDTLRPRETHPRRSL